MKEIKFAKIAAFIIVLLTILMAVKSEGADRIEKLFRKYNPKQAHKIAQIVKTYDKANVIAAIIVHESSVRPWVISKCGDYGLMQIRWRMHRKEYPYLTANDLLNAETNIKVGVEIFNRYYAQKKTLRGALLRYSGGNTNYANKVLHTIRELEAWK